MKAEQPVEEYEALGDKSVFVVGWAFPIVWFSKYCYDVQNL